MACCKLEEAKKLDTILNHLFTQFGENYISFLSIINTEIDKNVCPTFFCPKTILLLKIEDLVRLNVGPKFWKNYTITSKLNTCQGFESFAESVNELYNDFQIILTVLENAISSETSCFCTDHSIFSVSEYLKTVIQGCLSNTTPLHYTVIIQQFYKIAFNAFCKMEAYFINNSIIDKFCDNCQQDFIECKCQTIVKVFHEINRKLIELGLLERIAGSVLTSLIHIRIQSYVINICNQAINKPQLNNLENWLETVVANWLTKIFYGGSDNLISLENKIENSVNAFKQKLSSFLYETYTKKRIDQLFDILIRHQSSKAITDDLKMCLRRTNLKNFLIIYLKDTIKSRLLHPGINTPDILAVYIALVNSLKELDTTNILFDTVTDPIKTYLRGRDDTVRCVVSSLLNESCEKIYVEVEKDNPAIILPRKKNSFYLNKSIFCYDYTEEWENWHPDLIETDSKYESKNESEFIIIKDNFRSCANGSSIKKKNNYLDSDIISMLVNVYGSQDLFVNEYRSLLADRLLSQLDFNTEKENRQLLLLKERFGGQQLLSCEVMIKDVNDSQNIDSYIQQNEGYVTKQNSFSTAALIISAQFWPPFKEDWKLELPLLVQKQFQQYTQAFEGLKANRSISWKTHLGSVNLEIETCGRKQNFSVSPIHATIIIHFEEHNQWTLDNLSAVMHVPTTVLRRKINYWVSQSLIYESDYDTYVLQEKLDPSSFKNLPEHVQDIHDSDDDIESAMASANDQREEELQIFWSYIVGMLTNLDSMPLERIHQMLKMFASQGTGVVECGISELRNFLDNKVKLHQLLCSGGYYRLPRT